MEHDQKQILSDDSLELFFADAREETPLPSPDLVARIEADAVRLLPASSEQAVRMEHRRTATVFGWFDRLALPSGLLAAGVTGVWIGLSLGAGAGGAGFSLYESDLGMQILYEFPIIAGLIPEG